MRVDGVVRGNTVTSQKPDPTRNAEPGFGQMARSAPMDYSATTSRPWAVSAQMTAMSTAKIAIDQTG